MNETCNLRKKLIAALIIMGMGSIQYSVAGGLGILQSVRSDEDSKVRADYNAQLLQDYQNFLGNVTVIHRRHQCITENLAKEVSDHRSAEKAAKQGQTTWYGRIGTGFYNLYKYHQWQNPDYEYYIQQGKTPEDIAYSAFKTDGSYLNLSNNGVGDYLTVWRAIRSTGNLDIYPEDIDQKMVDYLKRRGGGELTEQSIIDNYRGYIEGKNKTPDSSANLSIPSDADLPIPASTIDEATQRGTDQDLDRRVDNALQPCSDNLCVEKIAVQLRAHTEQFISHTDQLNRVNISMNTLNHRVEVLDHQVDQLQNKVNKLDKKAMRGIATTAAMSSAASPSAPGKTAVGVGMGSYEGIQAIAITVSHRPVKLSHLTFQAGIGASNGGSAAIRIGFNVQF